MCAVSTILLPQKSRTRGGVDGVGLASVQQLVSISDNVMVGVAVHAAMVVVADMFEVTDTTEALRCHPAVLRSRWNSLRMCASMSSLALCIVSASQYWCLMICSISSSACTSLSAVRLRIPGPFASSGDGVEYEDIVADVARCCNPATSICSRILPDAVTDYFPRCLRIGGDRWLSDDLVFDYHPEVAQQFDVTLAAVRRRCLCGDAQQPGCMYSTIRTSSRAQSPLYHKPMSA